MMILFVGFQMFGEQNDSLGEDSDLNFRRSGVTFMGGILFDDFFL